MQPKPPSSNAPYSFEAQIFVYPGMAAWRFIAVPQKISSEIKTRFGKVKKGWGSIPVTATIGKTSWRTSIFPDKKSQSYLLPMKLEIRKKEKIMDGDMIKINLQING